MATRTADPKEVAGPADIATPLHVALLIVLVVSAETVIATIRSSAAVPILWAEYVTTLPESAAPAGSAVLVIETAMLASQAALDDYAVLDGYLSHDRGSRRRDR